MKNTNPEMKIALVMFLNPNYFTRDLWGYPEAMRQIASEFKDVDVIDAAAALQKAQEDAVSGKNYTEITSDGSSEYKLPWPQHAQGFRVMVNGQNLYRKTCYIKSGTYYALNPDLKGKALEFKTDSYFRPYTRNENMKLFFVKNPPPSGTKIRIEKSDLVWSGDFAHPAEAGCRIIGNEFIRQLEKFMK